MPPILPPVAPGFQHRLSERSGVPIPPSLSQWSILAGRIWRLLELILAERAGFEPALGDYPKHAFQACDLNRSSTSPGPAFYPEPRLADISGQTNNDSIIPPTASAIAPVASHPSRRSFRVMTNGPMISGRTAMRIITAMIGTATTPFSTADQNSALIGSISVKPSATPSTVANVMMK